MARTSLPKQAILCLAVISSDSSIPQALDRVGMLEEDARVKALHEAPRQVPSQPAALGVVILGSTERSGQLSQAVEQALLGQTFPTGSAPETYNLLCSVLAEAADGDAARLEQGSPKPRGIEAGQGR
ncbi:hypothetical protein DFJ74DRAFT_712337 [Hyaloraphidium curvatum]|nr:hypothetical protein DFJ74DRAFT_712337 [Hyaloraphidium curvatum]